MKRFYVIAISYFLCVCSLPAQSTGETYAFALAEWNKGNTKTALGAFNRVAFFSNDSLLPYTYYYLARCYSALNMPEKGLKYAEQGLQSLDPGDTFYADIILQKGLLYLQLSEYNKAITLLMNIQENISPTDRKKSLIYQAVAYYKLGYYPVAEQHFIDAQSNDSIQVQIINLFEALHQTEQRFNPQRTRLMSVFLPGSGQIVAGYPVKGMHSLLLNGGAVALFVVLYKEYAFLDAFLGAFPWLRKFYVGNVQNAYQLAEDQANERKQEIYQELIRLNAHLFDNP